MRPQDDHGSLPMAIGFMSGQRRSQIVEYPPDIRLSYPCFNLLLMID
jgi:hypothetical protein